LKKTSLGPLRQGQRLGTSETKQISSKEHKPPNQGSKPQRAPPAHMQAPPEPKRTPPELMQQCNKRLQQRATNCSPLPGRLDRLHRVVRPPTTHVTAWGRLDRPCTKLLRNCADQLEHLPNAPSKSFQSQTSPPCWQCMNQAKNAKNAT
jgi:hypothetical protein